MRGIARATLLGATAMLAVGCNDLSTRIDCGSVDASRCQEIANAVLAQKRTEQPTKRITSLVVSDDRGSYVLTWDDGTSEAMIVD